MGRELPPAEVLAADQRITAWARQLKKAGLDGDMDQCSAPAPTWTCCWARTPGPARTPPAARTAVGLRIQAVADREAADQGRTSPRGRRSARDRAGRRQPDSADG
jgi:hypothetical protein